jgi:predicted DNA-binding transcriptional regulator AlpA
MSGLRAIPTLDDLVECPAQAAELPADVLRALTFRALTALSALHSTMGQAAVPSTGERDQAELLGTREVARILDVSVSWIEKHVDDLPPRRSLCGAPRWLRADLEKWIKARPVYGKVA